MPKKKSKKKTGKKLSNKSGKPPFVFAYAEAGLDIRQMFKAWLKWLDKLLLEAWSDMVEKTLAETECDALYQTLLFLGRSERCYGMGTIAADDRELLKKYPSTLGFWVFVYGGRQYQNLPMICKWMDEHCQHSVNITGANGPFRVVTKNKWLIRACANRGFKLTDSVSFDGEESVYSKTYERNW